MSHDTSNLLDAMFDYGMDLRARRVFLHGALEPRPADMTLFQVELVVRALLYLDKSPGRIELWINSPGGDVGEMFALYDVIRTLDNPVDTVGFGQVASAAGLILAAGHRRYATSNCWFMSHGMNATAEGGIHETIAQVALYKRWEERWAGLMGKHTGRPTSWWKRLHDGKRREVWLDAREMVAHGIVDEIWPPEDDEE